MRLMPDVDEFKVASLAISECGFTCSSQLGWRWKLFGEATSLTPSSSALFTPTD
jgi:hypothetical protein